MLERTTGNYHTRIEELENRLAEAEALIEAIKAGEVDAFAFSKGDQHEVFTLQTGDFAYRIMVENINEGALNLSADQLIVYTNKSFYGLLQLPYEKVIGNPITTFIHPASAQTFQQLFEEALNGESRGEINLLAGEKIIPVYISLTSLQPTLPTVGMIITDLTEKKQAAKELEGKEFLQNIFKQSPAAIAILDGPEFVYASANQLYTKLVNRTENELLGRPLAEVFPEMGSQDVIDMCVSVYQSGEPLEMEETETVWDKERNGKMVTSYFNSVLQPIKDAQGRVVSIMSHVIEVTDQVLARRKIEQSELFSRSALESSPDCVKVIDAKGNLTYMNYKGQCIMELDSFDDIKDKHYSSLWPEENRHMINDAVAHSLKGNTSQFQAFCPTAKGTPKWWDVMVSPIIASDGSISQLISVSRDITADKQVQLKIEQSEQELQKIKEQLELSIEAGDIGLWYWDVQNDKLKWSKELAKAYGLPDGESVTKGEHFYRFVLPEDLGIIEKALDAAVENPYRQFVFRVKRADGEIRWMEGRCKVFPGANGKLEFISGINMDITERKLVEEKLLQSQDELNELANAVPQLVWMADTNGNILYYNNRIHEFTAEAKAEAGNWHWEKLLHPDDVAATMQVWDNAIAHKTIYEKEHRIKLKDGTYKWFLSRGHPQITKNGSLVKWYGTATDIHAQKMHEVQKDDFLKMVSHELKTPVTSIKGYVQLMLAMMAAQPNAVASMLQQPLERIDNQVERLGKLITEILDISRLEDGRLDMQKNDFRLDELVKETVQDILFATNTHNVVIKEIFDCTVHADKNRIGQALINLVNNAIKYSPENKNVEISMATPKAGYVAINIKDQGIGIEEAEFKKIFQRFYQSDGSQNRNYTGFGIGLYITAEIIKRHGGVISVNSRKNEGSVFTFTIPLAGKTAHS